MKEYKVGDKLICKKSIKSIRDSNVFHTNHKYEILNIVDVVIKVGNEDECWSFSLINTLTPYLWNYFYTPQETRKLKLKELNRC